MKPSGVCRQRHDTRCRCYQFRLVADARGQLAAIRQAQATDVKTEVVIVAILSSDFCHYRLNKREKEAEPVFR